MWKSTNFKVMASDFTVRKHRMTEAVKDHFDFSAKEDAEPVLATSGEVLSCLGMDITHENCVAMGAALRDLVGPSKLMRKRKAVGRYHALPPRKEAWL